jgi:tetratricopeptide (TPR) repeat protein
MISPLVAAEIPEGRAPSSANLFSFLFETIRGATELAPPKSRLTLPATLALLFLTFCLHAASPIVLFDQGNRLYEQGRFTDAAAAYQQLVASGQTSATVYYNLGNAWFKAGQLGRAVAAYRRAQELAPRDPNIRFNLNFARRQVTGSDAPEPPAFVGALRRLTVNEWTLLATGAAWICFLLLILREWRENWRRSLRNYSIAAGSVAALLIAVLVAAIYESARVREAVIVTQEAVVRFGPLEDSRVNFQLRNGAEVEVLGRKDSGPAESWLQVRDGSRRVGWLKRDQVVIL